MYSFKPVCKQPKKLMNCCNDPAGACRVISCALDSSESIPESGLDDAVTLAGQSNLSEPLH